MLQEQPKLTEPFPMNKKVKKQIEVLRKKQEKTQKLLSDAKAQTDDPAEVVALEEQIQQIKDKIEELKNA